MSPLPPTSRRAPIHTRTIQVDAFIRDDGLWELDAHITDIKASDITLPRGILPAGEPVHDLWLRLTLDDLYTIVAVAAHSEAMPYPGHCNMVSPAYNQLVGLSLLKGFRYTLKERIGGALGCTHLTELAQILPTVALQAFSGETSTASAAPTRLASADKKPFQVGSCYALRRDGAVVAQFYPKWSIAAPEDPASTPAHASLNTQPDSEPESG
ncbi:DUF2889 domain-containing protein [Glaciimonas sp. PAMC28666]|uniref:DUF2889 domain-containing protein n=1 Tax=Glaciimonas sp. PAMC28666 TaxID=2807626 RepID=UPI0019656A07|nr:DUF2889 domain-containing protein [Glaciimonas sp. PAMC28666]QRX84652.1 DUF2889 domain-containing protein [Glaciimonas sp. PAMC28666]